MMIPLYTIIGPRNEDDIIYATVKHMFTQGSDKVYIYDGGSPDLTREEAQEAGAEILHIENLAFFNEEARCNGMRNHLKRKLKEDNCKKAWVCFIDADDFYFAPPPSIGIKEYLNALSPEYNLIGCYRYEHFPNELPYYISHYHPLDFQPDYIAWDGDWFNFCKYNHWKHNFLIFEEGRFNPFSRKVNSFHKIFNYDREPEVSLELHHFPYREETKTRQRYEELCLPRKDKKCRFDLFDKELPFVPHLRKRFNALDDIYSGKLPTTFKINYFKYKSFRWYSLKELRNAKEEYYFNKC